MSFQRVTPNFEPVYRNNFFADFGYDVLKCNKITKNYFHFDINENNGKVIPLSTLYKLIDKEKTLNVIIFLLNNDGNTISIIYLEDVILLKIKDLNLSYESDDIIKIKVKYKKSNMRIFDNDRELISYQRSQKLKTINKFFILE